MITMMRRQRKALQIGLLVVIVAFVASLFIFGAGGMGDGGVQDWAARVNGEPIPIDRYQRRYQAYMDMYGQMSRERMTPALAERLGLNQQVLNDLIQETVVVQRARAEGLEVTDEELNAQLHQLQAFHENGRFSLRRYQEFLRRRGTSAASFEADVRRELTRIKVEGMVRGGITVTDAEVERHWVLQRETVRAAWALVDVAPIVTTMTATDDEIETFLKEHQAEFRQPERRRIQYVVVNPESFKKPVTDADVDVYYKEHPQEFETPRQLRVSHVLVRVPDTGGSEAEDKAKAKVADVIKRAKAGEPFAKLAKEMSEDPGSAANGGDLGFVARGELVPDFEAAAFELKRGDVSPEPVRTPFGFHAITVTDERPGGKKPLAAVAAEIRQKLTAEHAEQAAQARANELRVALHAAPDFMAEAKKLGLTPVETTMPRLELTTGLPRVDSVEETAFSLALGGVSAPVKTPAGYMVVKAVEHLPAAVPPLAEVREQVIAAVKRQKGDAAALERARQIAADAKDGDLAAAAKKVGATVGETPAFSRVKPAEKLPGNAMLAALQTPPGSVTEPVRAGQGYYVLKVLERSPGTTAELAQERDKATRELLAQKQARVWEQWVTAARAGARIEVAPRFAAPRAG